MPKTAAAVMTAAEIVPRSRAVCGLELLPELLTSAVQRMLMMIPVDNCEKIGVRPIISCEEADRLIDSMNSIEVQMNTNWNRRYRENMTKIKSGDLLEVATVIKGLMARDSEKGLSTGERKMLRSAKQILISELVMSKKMDYDAVEKKINAVLA